MEKFSAFRDPGTGIQPFLTPVPPTGAGVVAYLLLPLGYLIGFVRTILIVALLLVHTVTVEGVCALFVPVPPVRRAITYTLTTVIARLVLWLVGLWWIPVEHVTRKRGKGSRAIERWDPRAGDIIVSNWASWVELLWLAFRFNPVFVLPVCAPVELPGPTSRSSTPITQTPGRRTGTGSAAISSSATRTPTPRAKVLGFRRASLLSMLCATGHVPLLSDAENFSSLESIRGEADRPVVVFPECTTSNGRGLLRFAEVFGGIAVPVKKFHVFVMCVRYDPPTTLSPTLSRSIPSSLNPLPHIFSLATCLMPLTLSIRLLNPSESPSSGTLLVSEFITEHKTEDPLSEVCSGLVAQIGKMKRTGLGWEDKAAFLNFYREKK